MQSALQNVLSAVERDHLPPVCFLSTSDTDAGEEAALCIASRFCGAPMESLSEYPDFFKLDCPVKIDVLRELLHECSKRSFSEGRRCVYLTQAHLLSEMEQNLLLKTFEEPPRGTLFLLCGNIAAMLPTVQSRCSLIRLGNLSPKELGDMLARRGIETSPLYLGVSDTLAQAEQLCTDPEARAFRLRALEALCQLLNGFPPYSFSRELQKDRPAAPLLLSYWLSFARDLMAQQCGVSVRNTDMKKKLEVFSARFTSEQINCMIEMLASAMARLQSVVSVTASLDGMMTRILEEIT